MSVYSQAGTYIFHPQNTDGTIIKWTLNLNPDGTFLYHFLRNISPVSKVNREENIYCEGTWKLEGKLVIFDSDETEVIIKHKEGQTKHVLDFEGTKARYITKSLRDTSDREVKTALWFYESKMFHIKGLKLYKQ